MPDEVFNYHLYRVPPTGEPNWLSTTTRDGLGLALETLYEEGEFDGMAVGVLRRDPDVDKGEWLVNPYGTLPERER